MYDELSVFQSFGSLNDSVDDVCPQYLVISDSKQKHGIWGLFGT